MKQIINNNVYFSVLVQRYCKDCEFAFKIELRPIHVFRTTLETELKMRVGMYEYLHSTNLMVSVVSWFERSYVFLTR